MRLFYIIIALTACCDRSESRRAFGPRQGPDFPSTSKPESGETTEKRYVVENTDETFRRPIFGSNKYDILTRTFSLDDCGEGAEAGVSRNGASSIKNGNEKYRTALSSYFRNTQIKRQPAHDLESSDKGPPKIKHKMYKNKNILRSKKENTHHLKKTHSISVENKKKSRSKSDSDKKSHTKMYSDKKGRSRSDSDKKGRSKSVSDKKGRSKSDSDEKGRSRSDSDKKSSKKKVSKEDSDESDSPKKETIIKKEKKASIATKKNSNADDSDEDGSDKDPENEIKTKAGSKKSDTEDSNIKVTKQAFHSRVKKISKNDVKLKLSKPKKSSDSSSESDKPCTKKHFQETKKKQIYYDTSSSSGENRKEKNAIVNRKQNDNKLVAYENNVTTETKQLKKGKKNKDTATRKENKKNQSDENKTSEKGDTTQSAPQNESTEKTFQSKGNTKKPRDDDSVEEKSPPAEKASDDSSDANSTKAPKEERNVTNMNFRRSNLNPTPKSRKFFDQGNESNKAPDVSIMQSKHKKDKDTRSQKNIENHDNSAIKFETFNDNIGQHQHSKKKHHRKRKHRRHRNHTVSNLEISAGPVSGGKDRDHRYKSGDAKHLKEVSIKVPVSVSTDGDWLNNRRNEEGGHTSQPENYNEGREILKQNPESKPRQGEGCESSHRRHNHRGEKDTSGEDSLGQDGNHLGSGN